MMTWGSGISGSIILSMCLNELQMDPHIKEGTGHIIQNACLLHCILKPHIEKDLNALITSVEVQRRFQKGFLAHVRNHYRSVEYALMTVSNVSIWRSQDSPPVLCCPEATSQNPLWLKETDNIGGDNHRCRLRKFLRRWRCLSRAVGD